MHFRNRVGIYEEWREDKKWSKDQFFTPHREARVGLAMLSEADLETMLLLGRELQMVSKALVGTK